MIKNPDLYKVMADEADAIYRMIGVMDNDALELAVECIGNRHGNLITTGIGKSGIVARKIAGTFSSTGTPAFYVHPVEALHGDLGKLDSGDVLLVVCRSGNTREVVEFAHIVREQVECHIIVITAEQGCKLQEFADIVIVTHQREETGPFGLAPTTSSTCAIVVGDALAMAVMSYIDFTDRDYRLNHPGGVVGNE